MPSSRVCLSADLFTFAPWLALPAARRAAVPALVTLVAVHGHHGFLPWTPREIQIALHLSPKSFAALVTWMQRLQLGSLETLPSGEAIGLHVTGLLHATANTDEATLPADAEAERQRAAWREKKQKQRARRKTDAVPVPQNVPAPERTIPPNVLPVPSHTCAAASIESSRVEEDINISFDSNSIDRSKPDPPPLPTQPLTLQTADLVQALLRHGIPEDTARALIRQHGDQRIVLVLASVPHWKSKNPAAVIQDALKRPDKWPIPAAVAQQDLTLFTHLQPSASPRPAQANHSTAPPARAEPPPASSSPEASQRAQDTNDLAQRGDDDALEQEIWSRLPQPTRQKILECQDANQPLPPLVQGQWNAARAAVLTEAPHGRELTAEAASG
ncbi:MAG: hypothetical protein JWN14_4476 [Chthonomonadales bacterium]|nr:hypothetical protein [Chthonomonadales bacterium]